jgi:hypothetical protein
MSYDLDGRQSNESLNVSSSYAGCGVSIASVNSRTYDAEGHVTPDVCANAGTGTGVSIPACSPNSYFGGTTANLAWGPTGKLRTATNISASDPYEMTIHWDDDRPLFITDSTGALVQLSVETLGGTTYLGQSPYFFVLDRDFSGTQVSAHDSNGDDGPWEYGQLYSHVIGKGAAVYTGGWVGSTNAAGDSLVLAAAREDGYAVRGLMIQGVRSYDSNTEQWTTPDAYKGDVHDPMSQRGYMWNANNPIANADPSGFIWMPAPPYSFIGSEINAIADSTAPTASELIIATVVAHARPRPTLKTGLRLPDFTALQGCMGVGGGLCFTLSRDSCNKYNFQVAGNIGKSITPFSGSLTGNWLLGGSSPEKLQGAITGWGWSAGGGFIAGGQASGGIQWGIPPSGTLTSAGGGLFSPQIGISAGYTWPAFHLSGGFSC